MTRIRATQEIDSRYLAKQIQFLCTSGYFQYQCKKHVNQASINRSFLAESTPFLLPPTNEQRRIVAKIEALQERSRKAREALAEVGPRLEQFRQSLLAAAFRGDLTADWRAANPNVEPASELLNRIRQERRQKWEQSELAKMDASGRTSNNDNWKTHYTEPKHFSGDTFDLPKNWSWISFDQITASVLYGPRFGTEEYDTTGIPTVRTTDMDFNGNIRMTNAPCVVIQHRQRNHFLLRANDLVITRTGATIGKAALFDETIGDAIASAYLIRYRITSDTLVPKFLLYFLMSPHGQAQLIGGTQAVAQPNINTKTIAALSVPLPPYCEQKEIVEHLDSALSSTDAMVRFVDETETSLNQLDQSILAKAFRGDLVPQDPNDEPASVLLERIRAEREAADSRKSGKRKEVSNARK